jgi:aminoglycoside phosphotransferase (APT) family kinase protein
VPDLAARLERFFAARLPDADGLRIRDLETHTEGFSQETFSCTVEHRRDGAIERTRWVIKREPPAGLLEPYDLEPEFRVLHELAGAPLPAPRTPWFERDSAVLERPFYVMERLPGDVPLPVPGADGAGPFGASERAALAPQVMEALAALHAVDWRARGFEFLGAPPQGDSAQREVARWSARIRDSGLEPAPVVAEALVWLQRHAPVAGDVVLLHGDFRLGNWLVTRSGESAHLSGVLDWEMVHLGDPTEDVAWCLSHLWRGQTPRAACLAAPDELVALYERASGRLLDPTRLHFYEVLAVVKMLAIMSTGVRAFREGRTGDLRMAMFDHQMVMLHALLAALRGWLPLPS